MRLFALAVLFCGVLTAPAAYAATVISVGGATPDVIGGTGLEAGAAADPAGAIQTFTVLKDITDASISIDLVTCGPFSACDGTVELSSVGTGPDNPNLLAGLTDFCGREAIPGDILGCNPPKLSLAGITTNEKTVLTGISLFAGTTYTLAVGLTDGTALWLGTPDDASRSVTGTGDIVLGEAFLIPTLFVPTLRDNPRTSFLNGEGAFNFSIHGTVDPGPPAPTPVPLPAGGLLLVTALVALGARRRRT